MNKGTTTSRSSGAQASRDASAAAQAAAALKGTEVPAGRRRPPTSVLAADGSISIDHPMQSRIGSGIGIGIGSGASSSGSVHGSYRGIHRGDVRVHVGEAVGSVGVRVRLSLYDVPRSHVDHIFQVVTRIGAYSRVE
jgi:hypothetical protein